MERNKLTFFVGITTFNRLSYLRKLVESFYEYHSEDCNYILCINDDGSRDGTVDYLESLKDTVNIHHLILYSNHKGGNFCCNSIFHASRAFNYDLGFKLDDDLYFIKKGWEMLYYNACRTSNYFHLSHYSEDWTKPNIPKVNKGSLQSVTTLKDSQGAFYTFSKSLIEDVGFIDTINFGRRGEGHRDWSMRACRMKYNDIKTFFDAARSEDYIKLHSKEGYLLTPGYNEELKIASKTIKHKLKTIKDQSRRFIDSQYSPLNHLFDGVFCINLKRRADRKEKMERLFWTHSLDVKFIEAFDGGSPLVQAMFKTRKQSKYNLTAQMFGCHYSHLEAYKIAKEMRLKRPLILEDDLIDHLNINRMIVHLFKVKPDWRILYLGASDYNIIKNSQPLLGGYYKGEKVDGTFAYSVSHKILNELIEAFSEPVTMPCDTLLHLFQYKYKAYVVHPNLFIADVMDSDIRKTDNLEQRYRKVGWDINSY